LWRVYPDGCYDTRWLMGLWSTKVRVEGIVLKAVRHWGKDSNVVNDSLGEPGRTPLYVGLPFLGNSPWMVTLSFFPYAGGLLFGDSGIHT
jgi:hypothetical protein